MITIEKIDNFDSLAQYKPAWNALLKKSDLDVIFLTPEWLGAWWKIFGSEHKLNILLIKSDDELVGVAPLMITDGVIEFIGVPNTDYADIIARDKPEIFRHVLRYLDQRRGEWSRLSLSQIPERSASLPYLRGLADKRTLIKPIESCSAYVFEGSDEERAAFTFNRSKTVKTALNVLQKNGGLFYDRLTEPSAWKKYLPLLFHMHIRRWNDTPTPSKFLNEKHRAFYYELFNTLGEGACLFRIRNRNIPVALSFNFDYNCAITFFTLATNEYFSRRSPGQLLMVLQGETFIRQGYQLDYSRGAHEYKNLFANRFSTNYEFNIYAGRLSALKSRSVERAKSAAPIKSLLNSKRLENLKLTIVGHYKKRGLPGLVSLGLRGLKIIFERYIAAYRKFILYKFVGIPEKPQRPDPGIRIKKLTRDDTESIASFLGAAEDSPTHQMVIHNFEMGADCLAAICEGNIISISWGHYHVVPSQNPDFILSPARGEVGLSEITTSAVYKDQQIERYLLSYQINDYNKNGMGVIAGAARADHNRRALLHRYGFGPVKSIRQIRIFGIEIQI